MTEAEIDSFDRQAPDLIPQWVEILAEWRREHSDDYGRHTPQRRIKIGRNNPCTCGSGKKYKKCCGLN
jgi:uncharacterized protein